MFDNSAVVTAISVLVLLSPAVAFLTVIAVEMTIDLLMEARTAAICAVVAGAIGWVLFRKFAGQAHGTSIEV